MLLDLGVIVLLHFGVLLDGLVLGAGLDKMHLHVDVLIGEGDDLPANAVVIVGILPPLQIQVLLDKHGTRHVAPLLKKLHPWLQPLQIRFRRVGAIAAVLSASDIQLEVFNVAAQGLQPVGSSVR